MSSSLLTVLQDVNIKYLYVSLGDHTAGEKDKYEKVIHATEVVIHPLYNPNDFDNDIGESNSPSHPSPSDTFPLSYNQAGAPLQAAQRSSGHCEDGGDEQVREASLRRPPW